MFQKLIITTLFWCLYFASNAQLQTKVVGDSIYLQGNNNTAELILENGSKVKTGAFLKNVNNGRTEFDYIIDSIYKLNNASFVVVKGVRKDTIAFADLLTYNGLKRNNNTLEWGNDTLSYWGAANLQRPTVFNQNSQPFQWLTGNQQFHVTNYPYTPYNQQLALNYYTPFRISHDSQGFLYLENNYRITGWNGPTFGILFGNRDPYAQKYSYFGQKITGSIVLESLGNGAGGLADVPTFNFGIAGDTIAGRAATIMGTGTSRYGLHKLPTLVANYRLSIGGGGTPYSEGTNYPYTRFYANAENVPFVWRNLPMTTAPSIGDTVLSIDMDGNVRQKQLPKTLTTTANLDFGSTAPGNSTDIAIAVSGAEDGDAVSIGVPASSILPNSSYSAWVSASGFITIRFNNYSSGVLDPTGGTFKVKVLK